MKHNSLATNQTFIRREVNMDEDMAMLKDYKYFWNIIENFVKNLSP